MESDTGQNGLSYLVVACNGLFWQSLDLVVALVDFRYCLPQLVVAVITWLCQCSFGCSSQLCEDHDFGLST